MAAEEGNAIEERIQELLNAFKAGNLDLATSSKAMQDLFLQDLGHTVLDTHRDQRNGASEVIFGAGKTAEQLSDIIAAMRDRGSNILVTRLAPETHAQLSGLTAADHYDVQTQLWWHRAQVPTPTPSHIAVVTAGTSDLAVAEEAALTAEFYGTSVTRIFDVGVAGLHRLLARIDDLRSARVLVVVAGMEGALPSVVGGLVDKPVIAVPTSVGYGAAFEGVAALLGMLTSCASGVSVVNIDNGFGAGFLANRINRL